MRVLIAGASGLVGQSLLKQLVAHEDIKSICALTRSDLKQSNPKLQALEISLENLEKLKLPAADVAFCCLGTTLKKAGSKEAFYHVDHDLVLNFAYAAQKAGVKTFVLVSAMGANPKATVFYNQVKGQTEEDLKRLKFAHLIILQPSLLLGDRAESRPAERLAQKLFPLVSPLFVGPLATARPIAAARVANKMLEMAINTPPGEIVIIANKQI